MSGTAGPLPPREAYALWARTYDEETALSALDDIAVQILCPSPTGRLLDAGCGTGRRLPKGSVCRAVGLDLVPEMLAEGRRKDRSRRFLAGDLARAPLAAGAFDVAWCRLALGHLPALGPAYAELARALRPGGLLVTTDVHPRAAALGLRRTFHAGGVAHEVSHHAHDAAAHEDAAAAAGLVFLARLDLAIGGEVRGYFERAGALERYEVQRGEPVLIAFRFRRERS